MIRELSRTEKTQEKEGGALKKGRVSREQRHDPYR